MTTPDYKLIHVENPNTDYLDISELFRSDFDHIVKRINYNDEKNPFHVYEHVKQLFNGTDSRLTFPTITLTCDQAISLATISGSCEAHMNMRSVDGHVIADGDIHLIYIDSMPDIQTIDVENHEQLAEQIISSAMGINQMSFCKHRVNMSAKNIHYFGLNEDLLSSVDRQSLDDYNLENYSLQLLRKKGIRRILDVLLKKLEYEKIYIVFDMCCLQQSIAPSTYRYSTPGSEDGFTAQEIIEIFTVLRNHPKIKGIDITGFNFGLRKESTKNITNNQLTMAVIENILKIFVDIKKNSINIFNENSKFLIWRKLCDDDDDPVGWKILKGMSLEERERIMSSIDDDSVLTIPIVDPDTGDSYDALVTTTTVEEQQEKSYYVTGDYLGFCLLPGEKIDMIFELLNTPQNKIAE